MRDNVCLYCTQHFTKRHNPTRVYDYCSNTCKYLGRLNSKPAYNAIHKWVNYHLGTPRKCEHCGDGSLEGRRYDWANISREYKRDLSDWIRLCKKCHRVYDKKVS